MRTKNYIEFINEISSDLLKRASDKATSHGQSKLSKKFLSHVSGDKKHINSQSDMKMMSNYKFDYFLEYYNLDGEDIPFGDKGGVTKMEIQDFDHIDDETFWLFLHFPELDVDDNTALLSRIELYSDGGDLIIDQEYGGNKFANRRSVIKFIEMLKKLYLLHNPNIVNQALAKINGTHINQELGDGLYKWINYNFGSWETFRKKINVRELYDIYK